MHSRRDIPDAEVLMFLTKEKQEGMKLTAVAITYTAN